MKNKIGKINYNGIKLEPHEEKSLEFLSSKGMDIEIVRPVNIPHFHNPDILISGVLWELKGPDGKSEKTLEKRFKEASCQANNVIFDLRRAKITEKRAIELLLGWYKEYRKIRKIMIITKSGELLTYNKK